MTEDGSRSHGQAPIVLLVISQALKSFSTNHFAWGPFPPFPQIEGYREHPHTRLPESVTMVTGPSSCLLLHQPSLLGSTRSNVGCWILS